jgi:hypothetical protein
MSYAMEKEKLDMIFSLITELNNVYKNNPYICQRLETHLCNLPTLLDTENKKNIERINKQNELTNELELFCKIFLNRNNYFYMQHNNAYYEYDNNIYRVINEDNIHHQILSSISNDSKLIQWKYKAKQHVMKKIRERSLLSSTPETTTIQSVLSFFQTFFQTRSEIKYFLTVIGDCIFKKNQQQLYFVSSSFKKCISSIDSIIYSIIGVSILPYFITKYHDSHKIENYRIINTRNSSFEIVNSVICNIGIDIICVSAHYSDRYTTSDNYLMKKDELKSIQYFVNNSLEKIIDDFVKQSVEKCTTNNITWNNMHYIWKSYLLHMNIPNMIYSSSLQTLLKDRIEYQDNNDIITFKNVTSKYLPKVRSFLAFWETNITIIVDEESTYEIDELLTLYKSEVKQYQFSDKELIQMIIHYFSPQVEIIENKYITNIQCKLWQKNADINKFLDEYKLTNANNDIIISVDDLYSGYKTYIKSETNSLIVSKNYFERYIYQLLSDFIIYEKLIKPEWLTSLSTSPASSPGHTSF